MSNWSFLPKKTVTLDVSSNAIRLMVTSGKRVERWASAPLEPGVIEDGLVTDPPVLGAKIRRLMRSSGISGKRIIASIGGLYSLFRIVSVPESSEPTSDNMVLEAASEVMPVPVDQLYLSWQVVSNSETGNRAFVVGMPRNIVDAELQALGSAGITPQVLTLKGMALLKLVDEPQALIVNMEASSFDTVLITSGIPQLMRTQPQQPDVNLEERVDHLARTLWQTVHFYNSRMPHIPLEPSASLYLAGQLADNPEVADMVQSATNHPIAPLAIPLEYPRNLAVGQYAVNIGLAVGEVPTREHEEAESGEFNPEAVDVNE